MSKEKSFVVRINEKELNDFNTIIQKKSINRSELLRKWVREYIEDNKKILEGN